ncbi:hypothetical protein SDC9_04001 [bioreactor metagenome]|uniref:Tim44-like domain-containing protein n=1 Tax=bioreactor metagenome TaxID=1076179 RepID=A0A644SUV1_9ZZZZ|nr:hypothetical protein [Negativicutes bacterium]
MKKVLALVLIFVFAFSSVSFAAKGGSRMRSTSPSINSSMPRSAPSQAAPSTQGSNYKPSAPGSSYGDKAPASQTKPGMQQNAQQQTSGGFMRSAGLFGGGLLMGSMLGSMFGFGNMGGMLGSIMGILFDVIILAAVFMGARYLWTRFRNNKKDKEM